MMFSRHGVCLTCGCEVTIARYDSIARVLQRMESIRCPQCGCELAWKDAPVPSVFKEKRDAKRA